MNRRGVAPAGEKPGNGEEHDHGAGHESIETTLETAFLMSSAALKKRIERSATGFDRVLHDWCPQEEHALDIVLGWAFRPRLVRRNFYIRLWLQGLLLMANFLFPFWILAPFKDEAHSFASCPDDMVEAVARAGRANEFNASDTFSTAHKLLCKAEGWVATPIQGHVHNYGPIYQAGIYMHITFGGIQMVGAVVLLVVWFTNWSIRLRDKYRGETPKDRFCTHFKEEYEICNIMRRKQVLSIAHYYLGILPFVANITVAMSMALYRDLSSGLDELAYRGSFSLAFNVIFYFVTLVVLCGLIGTLDEPHAFHQRGLGRLKFTTLKKESTSRYIKSDSSNRKKGFCCSLESAKSIFLFVFERLSLWS
jgi:hypothetical protein